MRRAALALGVAGVGLAALTVAAVELGSDNGAPAKATPEFVAAVAAIRGRLDELSPAMRVEMCEDRARLSDEGLRELTGLDDDALNDALVEVVTVACEP